MIWPSFSTVNVFYSANQTLNMYVKLLEKGLKINRINEDTYI